MNDLHAEVLDLARALIRLDTTNRGHEGTETLAAEHLRDYLTGAGVEVELVAREPSRANVVARIPGIDPGAPSLAFVGHTDVVPVDGQEWTHPPFEAVVDDAGFLYGRGAIDMKNEVAARAVAMAELARTGFRPRGDLWFLAVADEEDGIADVGMRWLLEQRPDIRPTMAINEGGGERLPLTDGRTVQSLAIGEKGTCPVLLVALGESGHASMPELGDNAVPRLAELLTRIGSGMPATVHSPEVVSTLEVLGRPVADLPTDLALASALHPTLGHLLPALPGTTMAPTILAASTARNVMPARASVELDCRTLPGTTRDDVLAAVRSRLGDDLRYRLEPMEDMVPGSSSPATGPMPEAIAACLAEDGDDAPVLPLLCTGFTDSVHLRAAAGTAAYGFSPFRSTPAEVIAAGYHNADERIHVDDLALSARFHVSLARRLLGSRP